MIFERIKTKWLFPQFIRMNDADLHIIKDYVYVAKGNICKYLICNNYGQQLSKNKQC